MCVCVCVCVCITCNACVCDTQWEENGMPRTFALNDAQVRETIAGEGRREHTGEGELTGKGRGGVPAWEAVSARRRRGVR